MADLSQLTMFRQKDVEKLFAGCVFVNPIAAVQQCGWLEPESILNEQVRLFWGMVRQRVQPSATVDDALAASIAASLEVGISAELLNWSQDTTFSQLPLPYANEISRRSYLSFISGKFSDLVKAIQRSDDGEVKNLLRAMSERDTGGSAAAPDAYDVATQFQKVVDGGVRSVPFRVPGLDSATGGMERQTLTILAARPSVGKTALGWQVAQSVAYAGKRALFISLEMSSVNLWGRAACPKVGTTWRDVRAGKLNEEARVRLVDESFALALQFEDRLKIIDTPQTTGSIWQAVSEYRPELLVVDHLRLVKDQNQSEVKRLGEISQRLKDIAKSFNCAVLLLAQLNRQSETRQEKRPILADLRDSGEIEENGDLILMMHREEPQGERKPEKSLTEVWVRKFRDGPRDVLIKLLFDPKEEWFEGIPK
jgi:KaiC/GvpD/RAD55 family RecA-like ATPase